LTEGKLRGIIAESVRRALMENDDEDDDYYEEDYDENAEFLNDIEWGLNKYVWWLNTQQKREFMSMAENNMEIIEAAWDNTDLWFGWTKDWFMDRVSGLNQQSLNGWDLSSIFNIIGTIKVGYQKNNHL
jgi:hypothetical protein